MHSLYALAMRSLCTRYALAMHSLCVAIQYMCLHTHDRVDPPACKPSSWRPAGTDSALTSRALGRACRCVRVPADATFLWSLLEQIALKDAAGKRYLWRPDELIRFDPRFATEPAHAAAHSDAPAPTASAAASASRRLASSMRGLFQLAVFAGLSRRPRKQTVSSGEACAPINVWGEASTADLANGDRSAEPSSPGRLGWRLLGRLPGAWRVAPPRVMPRTSRSTTDAPPGERTDMQTEACHTPVQPICHVDGAALPPARAPHATEWLVADFDGGADHGAIATDKAPGDRGGAGARGGKATDGTQLAASLPSRGLARGALALELGAAKQSTSGRIARGSSKAEQLAAARQGREQAVRVAPRSQLQEEASGTRGVARSSAVQQGAASSWFGGTSAMRVR